MHKSYTLLFTLLFLSLIGQAQTNFKPGIVVTSAGDTLKGFIDHREWLRNPEEITFSSASTGTNAQKFTPANSRYVEVSGVEAYQSEKVKISLAPIEISNLTYGVDTTTLTSTVFLRVVYAGTNLSLFSYRDKIKERLYVQESKEAGTAPLELMFRRYYVVGKTNLITTEPIYKNQLNLFAIRNGSTSESLKRKIENTNYEKQSVANIISQLDGPKATASATSFTKYPRIRFLAGVWANRTTMHYEGNNSFAEGAESTASYKPGFSVGFDVFANPNTQRLIFRTELSLTMAEPEITKDTPYGATISRTSTFSFKQRKISINPQVLYHVYHGDKVKFYVGAGVIGSYSSYSKNKFSSVYVSTSGTTYPPSEIEPYESLEDVWYSFTLRSGFTLNNHLDVSVLYTPNDIAGNSSYTIIGHSLNFGVSYLFTRKPKE